jgi:hypothetical protein
MKTNKITLALFFIFLLLLLGAGGLLFAQDSLRYSQESGTLQKL